MKSIVAGTGLGQRRCERAIAQLKTAGFMKVDQPRHRNEDGKYVGLRAVRLITRKLFEWLNLGPMLDRERKRASQALGRRAAQLGRTLGDLVGRRKRSFRMDQAAAPMAEERRSLDPAVRRDWNTMLVNYLKAGMEVKEAQIKTNRHFGFPLDWSPGQGAPAKA